MLNNSQINFLAKISNIDAYKYGDLIIGVNNRQHFTACVKYPYEEFKTRMGLQDIRFDWLLTDKVFLAGGAVLNWVWGENKNEDIDFFFTNPDSAQNFRALIQSYGFVETSETKYAMTCFNDDDGTILQVVGTKDAGGGKKDDQLFNGFIPCGTPPETISRFDIELCKFAVDGDSVYFTVGAALNLMNKTIHSSGQKYNTSDRVLKYNRKGFYIPNVEEQPKDVSNGGWY